MLRKAGEKTDSSPLKADALHYASDLYSNSATVVAIILTYYTGRTYLDLLFSVIIAFLIIFSALKIFRNGIGGLMDISMPHHNGKEIAGHHRYVTIPLRGISQNEKPCSGK